MIAFVYGMGDKIGGKDKRQGARHPLNHIKLHWIGYRQQDHSTRE